MSWLTADDFTTHLYSEVINEISREDDTILGAAIDAAVEEATGYLTPRYDTVTIFETAGDARNPILLLYVKDLAVWHFVSLANPNISMELALTRYEKAIAWLRAVQSGLNNPNLPEPLPDADGNEPDTGIEWRSNRKRWNDY